MVFGDCVHDKYMTTGIYKRNGGVGWECDTKYRFCAPTDSL